MPHIVLNTRKQKSIRADDFVASQRLSLEGNFDQYFDLYCPQQYEIETLALLNPSFMTTLIDSSGNYDIEINDTHLALCRTVSARFLSRFSFDRNRDFRVYGELFSALSQLVNHFDRKPSASSGLAVIGSLPPTLTKKSLLQRLPRTLRKTIKFVLIGLILWILYIAVIDSIIK